MQESGRDWFYWLMRSLVVLPHLGLALLAWQLIDDGKTVRGVLMLAVALVGAGLTLRAGAKAEREALEAERAA